MHILVAGHAVFWPGLALLGLAVGYIAGMFGIGGGFLLTPLLNIVFGIPMAIAVGSALCQKIGTSIGSFLKHRQYRHGEPRIDWVMLGGSMVGVDAGARTLNWLSHAGAVMINGRSLPLVTLVLDGCYALLLGGSALASILAAVRAERGEPVRAGHKPLLLRVRLPPYISFPSVGIERASVITMAYIGFVTGVLSGLLGIGGGVVLLPVLIYGYGMSIKDAAGTGILLLFATVTVGTIEHAWLGNVDLRVALAILAGSSVGAQLGARSTSRLSNRALRIAFAALLLGTVAAIGGDMVHTITR
ncbi:MAG TPA: sulfite exporter TauE/SafE family protein [Polyangia bacterium]|jgi:hypothetical protein